MMTTLASIWAGIKLIFTSGVLWKTLLTGIASKGLTILTNKSVQQFALFTAFSLQLNTEMTTWQKTKAFNKQVYAYLEENNILTTSGIVNFLRELAYQSMTVLVSQQGLETAAASVGAKAYIPTAAELKD